jgi:hypothetical protein
MTKKDLGQFFTTDPDYILKGFNNFVKNKIITDPFAGNQDLFSWGEKNKCKIISGFDYDKKYVDNKKVFFNDSLNNSQKYKFVLTNPPYLNKNKASKEIKEKFFTGKNSKFEDLYQVSIASILNSEEGILIVPLNFLCARNSRKIRNLFFEKFEIIKLNIFLEQVFEDTTYNVISFYYKKKIGIEDKNKISADIFPKKQKINFNIEKRFDWQLGGDFLRKIKNTKNHLKIKRFTKNHLENGNHKAKIAIQNLKEIRDFYISKKTKNILEKNILLLRAIDSKNGKKIQIEDLRNYDIQGLAGKNSSRSMAHIIFGEEVSLKEQKELLQKFNEELRVNREKYFSFFLTNFRDNGRKRISFDFAYKLLNYLYFDKINNHKQKAFFG